MLYAMLTGFVPFASAQAVVDVKYDWPHKIAISSEAKSAVARCLQVMCVFFVLPFLSC